MITTKKIAIEYAQKEIRNLNISLQKKNQLNTKEFSNAGNKGQKVVRHIEKKIVKWKK